MKGLTPKQERTLQKLLAKDHDQLTESQRQRLAKLTAKQQQGHEPVDSGSQQVTGCKAGQIVGGAGKPTTAALTPKQERTFQKLLAKDDLTDSQRQRLLKLKRKRGSQIAVDSKHAQPSLCTSGVKSIEDASVAPSGKRNNKTVRCSECDAEFTFSWNEQAWFAEKGFSEPRRCNACVQAKKQRFKIKEEKQRSGVSGHGRCFNCGGSSHLSHECPEPRRREVGAQRTCYTCGQTGHLTRNCPDVKPKSKGACYICGSTEHISSACSMPRPPPTCFNCGRDGHTIRSCELPARTSGVCYAFVKGQCNRGKKCKFVHSSL